MSKTLCLKVWGDYACFTRPEMKVERVSYDVITPSAARAVFEAILWKPEIRWTVTRIEVLKPIRWISVRRNEVEAIASEKTARQSGGLYIEDQRQQRAALLLRDVAYRLHARLALADGSRHVHRYPELRGRLAPESEAEQPDCLAKYLAMFQRRARKGQCIYQPYLGCREFSAYFELVEDAERAACMEPPIADSRDLGWMLYDIDFARGMTPMFYRAQMQGGVIDADGAEVRR